MAKPERTNKPGPKPAAGVGRSAYTAFRSTPAYKSWLDRVAEFERVSVADVIDRAVVEHARKVGFPEAAPPR